MRKVLGLVIIGLILGSTFLPLIKGAPVSSVHLRSRAYDGITNLGSILVVGAGVFNLPADIYLENGQYEVIGGGVKFDGKEYSFDKWEGPVSNPSQEDTILSVSGEVTLTLVLFKWDFALDVFPLSRTVNQGDGAIYDVTVTATGGWTTNTGQTITVDIETSGEPSGTTRSGPGLFSLSQSNPTATSTYTIFTSENTPTGTYNIVLKGTITSTTTTHSQTIELVVEPKPVVLPDLIIENFWWSPANPQPGDEVTFTYTEKNQDLGDAPAHRNTLFIDNYPISNDVVEALAAGTSRTRTFSDKWTMTAGAHEALVKADDQDAVTEKNEENNVLKKTIGVKEEVSTSLTINLNLVSIQPNIKVWITISGRLTRSDTGISDRPIGLEWTGGMATTTTNADGYYSYTTDVGPYSKGSYTFTAKFEGYETPSTKFLPSIASTTLSVGISKIATSLTINLNPEIIQEKILSTITISGQLTRGDTNVGLASKTISLTWIGSSASATTDLNGDYSYQVQVNLDQGSYNFHASFEGDTEFSSISAQATLTVQAALYFFISLSSKTTDGLLNVGSITFDGTTYNLSIDIQKVQGSYQVIANPPGSYSFHHWESKDGISIVGDPKSRTISVNVNNAGQLIAVFFYDIRFVFAVGENYYPVAGMFFDDYDITNNYQNYRTSYALPDVDQDSQPDVPAYVYKTSDGGYNVIEYWIYYAYDDKFLFDNEALPFMQHEHDFEYIYLWVDSNYRIVKISLNQHMWTNNYLQSIPTGTIYIGVEKGGHGMIMIQSQGDGTYVKLKPDNSLAVPYGFAGEFNENKGSKNAPLYPWRFYTGSPVEGFGDQSLLMKAYYKTGLLADTAHLDLNILVPLVSIDWVPIILDLYASLKNPILLKSSKPVSDWFLVTGVGGRLLFYRFYIEAPWIRREFSEPQWQWIKLDYYRYSLKKGVSFIINWITLGIKKTLVEAAVLAGAKFAVFGLPTFLGIINDPTNLTITDTQGNVLGYKNGQLVNEIPGGMILFEGENYDIYLLSNNATDFVYTLKSEAVGDYNFTVIAAYYNETVPEVYFNATSIPIETTSLHAFEIDWIVLRTGGDGTRVSIDQDGDGTVEQVLKVASVLVADLVTPPTAVTVHNISDITENSLKLAWTPNTEADFAKYEIYISTSLGNIGTKIRTVTDRLATSYVVTGLTADTTYYFIIRVIDTGGLYADSDLIIGRTSPVSTVPIWVWLAIVIVSTLAVTSIAWGIKRRRRNEKRQ